MVTESLTGNDEQGTARVHAVVAFYAAVRDRRIGDILALVDPQVSCFPLVRPGLSVYHGHDGMIRLSEDMHAAHGQYDFRIDRVTEDGDKVTVYARILPEPRLGQAVLPVFTCHHKPGGSDGGRPVSSTDTPKITLYG